MIPRKRAVTIKDVAAEAGVSFQTVSRVVNKGPNVTPAMQARVREAIAKLGYVPNLAARRLGGTRSWLILALNDRQPTVEGWKSPRGNDWVDQMLYGGMLKSAEHGYRMFFELVDSHSDEFEAQVEGALAALHPDGVILTPPHSENDVITALLQRNGIPFARIGSRRQGSGIAVHSDDRLAGRAATEHLVELGHKRIAFVRGPDDYVVSADRLTGFREVMAEAGLAVEEGYVQPGDFSYESGVAAMAALAGQPVRPTALVACSGESALGVLHAATRHGIAVPHDLSIVAFDDTPTVRMAVPSLTAIRQPIAEMAARAAELLIDLSLRGHKPPDGVELPFELIVRDSSAPPP